MRRVTILAAAAAAAASLTLAACGGSSSTASSSSSGGSAAASKLKVGLAYDIGGRGDKSFNDSAATGLDKAKADLGIEYKELSATQGETDSDKEARLKLLAQGGYNPVIAIGFLYATALKKVAAAYPKTQFAIIDSSVLKDDGKTPVDNVTGLDFAENEGSYLVGVAAALKTKTKSVAYIGGCDTALLRKFQAGFEAGVKATDASIKTTFKYLSLPPDCKGFNDPASGKETATGMYDGGADIIFAAAGGSGTGVFQAAAAKKSAGKSVWAIGVDSDQYQTAAADLKPVILTSMLKRVDTAVYDFIKSASDGNTLKGIQVFDLKKDGVGYATSGGQVDDIKTQLDKAKAAIIAGTIKVPTTTS